MGGTLFRDITAEFLDHYLLYSEDRRTMRLQVGVLERHFGALELERIGVPEIEAFVGARLREGVSKATVNRQRAALSVVLGWAIERGRRAGPNPVRAVRRFRESPGRTRYLTPGEADRLVMAAAPHLKPLLMTALHTGGRRGELLSLCWGDIDLEAGGITFRRETTKARKTRTVPINRELRAALAAMRRGRADVLVFQYNERPLRSVRSAFLRARRQAGLGRDVTFHTLRHTFASWATMNGLNPTRLQQYLGHADLSMTQRYSHLSREYLEDGARFLGPPASRSPRADEDRQV